MGIDHRIINGLRGTVFEQTNRPGIVLLFEVYPTESVCHLRIIWVSISGGLGERQGGIEIPAVLGIVPRHIVRCWHKLWVDFERFLIIRIGLLRLALGI